MISSRLSILLLARELHSNRTVANFLPVSRSCTISQRRFEGKIKRSHMLPILLATSP
jgi:hypothetical protein